MASLFASCAASKYHNIEPKYLKFTDAPDSLANGQVKINAQYNILKASNNRKYSNNEIVNKLSLLAVQIENNSTDTLFLPKDIYVMAGQETLTMHDMETTYQKLQQDYGQYSSDEWTNLESELIGGLTNGLIQHKANKQFFQELDKYYLLPSFVAPGATTVGLLGLEVKRGTPLKFGLAERNNNQRKNETETLTTTPAPSLEPNELTIEVTPEIEPVLQNEQTETPHSNPAPIREFTNLTPEVTPETKMGAQDEKNEPSTLHPISSNALRKPIAEVLLDAELGVPIGNFRTEMDRTSMAGIGLGVYFKTKQKSIDIGFRIGSFSYDHIRREYSEDNNEYVQKTKNKIGIYNAAVRYEPSSSLPFRTYFEGTIGLRRYHTKTYSKLLGYQLFDNDKSDNKFDKDKLHTDIGLVIGGAAGVKIILGENGSSLDLQVGYKMSKSGEFYIRNHAIDVQAKPIDNLIGRQAAISMLSFKVGFSFLLRSS